MRTIAIFDEKNYKLSANRFTREAVRAVIIKDGKVALVKSLKENHYKFPGGGIEENESHIDTLIRETKEETGLVIKSSTIKECGLIHEIRKSIYNDDVFEQKSYYYFAEVEDIVLKQELSENEKELKYVLEWVNPSFAYEVNTNLGKEYANKFLLREACVLKLLIDCSVKLVKPTKEYFNQLLELKQDFITNNEPRIQGSGSLDKYDDLNEWLKSINEIEQGLNPKLVPTTYYLILLDNEVVGTISMRHYLTKDLEEFGGHIGYSIKPRARRKGYAKEALRILLDLYKDKYDEILIMCEDDNIASNKTVLANGGVLINKIEKFGLNINRYKIICKLQNLLIKKINVNNKEECHELINYAKNCSWQSTGEYFAEIIENNEFTDSEIVIGAYLDNKVVGFAALVNDSVAENFNESPFLDFLFVEEEYRNRGIVTKLVNYIVDYAKEKYDTIYLVTVSHELFYKKLGFETMAKSTVIDCIDECFIMKKNI